jgi:hypothetical protein
MSSLSKLIKAAVEIVKTWGAGTLPESPTKSGADKVILMPDILLPLNGMEAEAPRGLLLDWIVVP